MEKQDKKFSLPEMIIMTMIVAPVDLLEGLSTALFAMPVIGQIIMVLTFIAKLFSSLTIQFWLIMKGIRGSWFLSGSLIDLAPILNAMPTATVCLFLTFYLTNNPRASALAKKVTALKPGLKISK